MANIDVRRDNGNKPAGIAKLESTFDPLRMMREMLSLDPFREMMPYLPSIPAGFAPGFEIKESKDGYLFKADLPGVKDSDIEVTVTGNRLTISGKREAEKEEKSDTYYACERSYGEFTRAFTLPEGVEMNSVRADLKDGVLSVSVHKAAEAQAKKIPVQTTAKKS